MNEIFDLAPIELDHPVTPYNKKEILFDNLENDLKSDYEKTRETLDELIEKGKIALDDIISIAKDSEKARDFEVAATMLKAVVEANQQVLDLHKKIRDIANYKENVPKGDTNINNTLFIGSTADLSKMLRELKEKDNIIEDVNNE